MAYEFTESKPIKEVSYEEYLRMLDVDVQCKTLDELYTNMETHDKYGNYFEDDEDNTDSLSSTYWDYPEEELEDVLADHTTEDGKYTLVKIDDRYFEIPEDEAY